MRELSERIVARTADEKGLRELNTKRRELRKDVYGKDGIDVDMLYANVEGNNIKEKRRNYIRTLNITAGSEIVTNEGQSSRILKIGKNAMLHIRSKKGFQQVEPGLVKQVILAKPDKMIQKL